MPCEDSLLFSNSKDGKTTELWQFIDHYTKKTNTTARLITADLGGIDPFIQSGMEEENRVDILKITVDSPFDVLNKLADGYWPFNGEWKLNKPENVSILAIEGITSIATVCLEKMKRTPTPSGFKKSFTFQEGSSTISGLNEGHYGIVQDYISTWIRGFKNTCDDQGYKYLIWTALQEINTNKQTDAVSIVPSGAGSKQNTKFTSWFSNSFFLSRALDEENQEQFIMRFEPFNDSLTGARVACGTRMLPEVRMKMLEKYPEGIIVRGTKGGLVQYFGSRNRLLKERKG